MCGHRRQRTRQRRRLPAATPSTWAARCESLGGHHRQRTTLRWQQARRTASNTPPSGPAKAAGHQHQLRIGTSRSEPATALGLAGRPIQIERTLQTRSRMPGVVQQHLLAYRRTMRAGHRPSQRDSLLLAVIGLGLTLGHSRPRVATPRAPIGRTRARTQAGAPLRAP